MLLSHSQFADLFGGGFFGVSERDSAVPPVASSKGPDRYKVPEERAAKRPHELGWLDLLKDEKKERTMLGRVPAGRIIPDEE